MSIFSNSDDPAAAEKGALPAEQQKRADEARPQAATTATEAKAGTPQYGDFGDPNKVVDLGRPANNDGSNDNPDEFSEFRDNYASAEDASATKDKSTSADNANLVQQRGHTVQNEDPQAVRAVQNADADAQRTGWSEDDERYAGGHKQPTWEENNAAEHSND